MDKTVDEAKINVVEPEERNTSPVNNNGDNVAVQRLPLSKTRSTLYWVWTIFWGFLATMGILVSERKYDDYIIMIICIALTGIGVLLLHRSHGDTEKKRKRAYIFAVLGLVVVMFFALGYTQSETETKAPQQIPTQTQVTNASAQQNVQSNNEANSKSSKNTEKKVISINKIEIFFALCDSGEVREVEEVVLKKGIDVNKRRNNDTPLTLALQNAANVNVISALINAGADVKARNFNTGNSPLMIAVYNDIGSDIVSILLKSMTKEDINVRNKREETALILAAEKNTHPDVVSALLKAGADINARRKIKVTSWFGLKAEEKESESTILMLATFNKNPEILPVLIKNGSDVNAQDESGMTPLMFAIGNARKIEILLENGANIDKKDANGRTALMYAVRTSNLEDVITLLEGRGRSLIFFKKSGADVNTKDNEGATPLMYATKNKKNSGLIIPALLKAGAKINTQTTKGWVWGGGQTALMLAVQAQNAQAISLLLEAKADVNIQDKNGKRAIDYAGNEIKKSDAYWKLKDRTK